MINVRIDNETALDMLMERVEYWTDDSEILELYRMMYSDYIDSGCFDGCEFDVMVIVDNDYINYCSTIEEGDSDFETLKKAYEDGERDVSELGLDCGASYVEAMTDSVILIRQ